jgi:guanylate kinase
MIQQGKLLEHALVYGEYKGVPKAQVCKGLRSGQDIILRLDVQGADTLRKLYSQVVTIFVTAPTESELFERLEKRKTESPEKLDLRKQTAKEELEQLSQFDYVIYNESGHLDEAVDQILAIIEAEHNKAKNVEENL